MAGDNVCGPVNCAPKMKPNHRQKTYLSNRCQVRANKPAKIKTSDEAKIKTTSCQVSISKKSPTPTIVGTVFTKSSVRPVSSCSNS